MEYLNRLETWVRRSQKKVVVAGDFNAKSPEWGGNMQSDRGRILSEWVAGLNLTILNDGEVPTLQRLTGTSFIDVTFSSHNLAGRCTRWEVLTEVETLSDHLYIEFEVLSTKNRSCKFKWVDGPTDRIRFSEVMKELIRTDNPAQVPEECTNLIKKTYRAATPRVRIRAGTNPPFWWNLEIAELRLRAHRARRAQMRYRTMAHRDEEIFTEMKATYNRTKKELRHRIAASKRECWLQLIKNLNEDIWGEGYKIIRRELKMDWGTEGQIPPEKKRALAEQLFPAHEVTHWERVEVTSLEEFTEKELQDACSRLKTGRAPGPDRIRPETVKLAAEAAPEYICQVMNNLLRAGIFPECWKQAKAVFIRKPAKNAAEEEQKYRPICLLNTLCKLYERLLATRLQKDLEERAALSGSQFGFRPKKSTVQAVERAISLLREADRGEKRKWSAMLAVDVSNAFNTVAWKNIISSMVAKSTEPYIINTVKDYLSERSLIVDPGEIIKITAGVPQGSVLGPTLWNLAYDGVLELELPEGSSAICYADDLAVITAGATELEIKENTEEIYRRVDRWMTGQGLTLAPEKTEVLIYKNMRRPKHVNFRLGNKTIEPCKNLGYLGITLDANGSFGPHLTRVCGKAEKTIAALSRILPNVRGPTHHKRMALWETVKSILLYGAQIWADSLRIKRYEVMINRVQRKMLLRICMAYRTVSNEALTALAGIPPIALLAEERAMVQRDEGDRVAAAKIAEEITHTKWEDQWRNSEKGSWTKCIITNLRAWRGRRHGELDFYMTQAFTGHGCFREYTRRLGKSEDGMCSYCPELDTAEHTLFNCARWTAEKTQLDIAMGVQLNKENIMEMMIKGKRQWNMIARYIAKIMRTKEADEREIQRRI